MPSSKLPGHLASLLRHRTDGPAAEPEAAEATTSGRQVRRKAAREKRRVQQAAGKVAAQEAEKAEKAERRAKAEAAAAAKDSVAEEPVPVAKKRKKLKKRKGDGVSAADAAKKRKVRNARASFGLAADVGDSTIDRAAAEDLELQAKLEKKLGLGGDPEKRRRMEKKMFAELGFGSDDESDDEEADGGGKQGIGALMAGLLGGRLTSEPSRKKKQIKKKRTVT
eukprot:gnl/TRDRNA2_/TRDRNA2_187503_c0_seq1.p1 gnl/TRDRNA2_/TRDRNA2_187503_c0~~gnl/TRDRNA2_/TRDRNA2_187503_c0_seq1.p1  ORF type:complete len:223 (+),score=80.14 gnl/TRDRNA2_/TRDRNA2_187503_c0_seq1:91-759(+)